MTREDFREAVNPLPAQPQRVPARERRVMKL